MNKDVKYPLCITLKQYKVTNPNEPQGLTTNKSFLENGFIHQYGHDSWELTVFTDNEKKEFSINGWTFKSEYEVHSFEGYQVGFTTKWDLRINVECISPKDEYSSFKLRSLRYWKPEDPFTIEPIELLMNSLLSVSICDNKTELDSIKDALSIYPHIPIKKEQLEGLSNYSKLIDKYSNNHNEEDVALQYTRMDIVRRIEWVKEQLSTEELIKMFCPWF